MSHPSFRRRTVYRMADAALIVGAASTTSIVADAAPDAGTNPAAADRTLRVYSNNIENLVQNGSNGSCTRISGPDHLTSILVDDNGKTGTAGVLAPDLLIVQQIRGRGQADAYADQLSAKFHLPKGTH